MAIRQITQMHRFSAGNLPYYFDVSTTNQLK